MAVLKSFVKNCAILAKNTCLKFAKRLFAWGGGIEMLFGKIPFEYAYVLPNA